MALHFAREEFEARLEAARIEIRRNDLAALLLFAQESHYYLTGFDTSGYVFFQCLVVTADGGLTLLTRRPDLAQARITSIIDDVRLWFDSEDADPSRELQDILAGHGLAGTRIGVEMRSYGLTVDNWERVRGRLGGWCELVDASGLVRGLRLVKSTAE